MPSRAAATDDSALLHPHLLREALVGGSHAASLRLGLLSSASSPSAASVFFEHAASSPDVEVARDAFFAAAGLHSSVGRAEIAASCIAESLRCSFFSPGARQLGLCFLRGYGVAACPHAARALFVAALDALGKEGGGAHVAAIAAGIGGELRDAEAAIAAGERCRTAGGRRCETCAGTH